MNAVVVSIEHWTLTPFPSSVPQDRWSLDYTDPATGRVHRPATRETELEARRFARTHGWTVERVVDEEAGA